MKIHIHNTQQGFIALFFTLSMSTILLAYVAASSASVFDFMRARGDFEEYRNKQVRTIECADRFIDMIVRSPYGVISSIYDCSITQVHISRIDVDTTTFSFVSGRVYVRGSIKNGFIMEIQSSHFSL